MMARPPLRTLIADDEAPARRMVRDAIAAMERPEAFALLPEAANGLEALEALRRAHECGEPVELLFLDVQMPGLTGFEVLAEAEARGLTPPYVVFTTAFDQHAVRAFEVAAVDYLLKPFTQARFAAAVERVQESRLTQSPSTQVDAASLAVRLSDALKPTEPEFAERLLIGHGGVFTPIAVRDVLWVEAAGDYARLHTRGRTYLAGQGITALASRLDPRTFARVHRSAIVNLDALRSLERDGSGGFVARLEGGATVRVSRTYADAIRALIA